MTHNKIELCPTKSAKQILADCPLLRIKLARALFCQPHQCQQAMEEVIKFLCLAAQSPGQPVTPSARVDIAWHEFILFTRTYASFCQDKLGRMIHHEPSIDHQINSQQYASTLHDYRQQFGEPPTEYWGGTQSATPTGVAAFCGSCEADI